jgi:Uma2 family endonuclease
MYSAGYHVRVQLPLDLTDDSEPEPDLAVVIGSPEDYWREHPQSALLIVEVAYSSLEHDQQRKQALYARCQIPEYWILNLNERQLEVYRQPQGEEYQSKIVFKAGDEVAPFSRPENLIAVADLLPR